MNLIASVLHLDRTAIKALRITDPYSLHRVVYSLYENTRATCAEPNQESSGILYADQGGDFNGRRILMLTNRPPADCIDGQFGRVQQKPIPDGFLDHATYRFKVIVNPVYRDNATRKLIPARGRAAIEQWFCERAPKNWGLEPRLTQLEIGSVQVLQFRDKQKQNITLAQAELQGVLTVTRRDDFQHAFAQGIGRGKAFGCGLLQLVPIIENPFI